MKVLVTGMIAGMDDAVLLDKVAQLARFNKIDIDIYNAVDEFTKCGQKPFERLLATTDYVFELTREREYEKIGFEMARRGTSNVLVRLPATVEWNRVNRKFKDQRILREFIRPDLIVTLIEAEWLIKRKLDTMVGADPFLRALKDRNHTLYEILAWMHEEVSLSEDWARYMGVPHVVMSVGEPPTELLKLATTEDPWKVYASYSMTHADEEGRAAVNKALKRLRDYAVVCDPQTIEIGATFDSQEDKEAIYSYTVHRDLHWYVGKYDAVIAIHPYPTRPPLSMGMMDELGHARDYMKARYMVFPKGFSPFTTDSYIEKGHLFQSVEEMFDYFDTEEQRPRFSFQIPPGME